MDRDNFQENFIPIQSPNRSAPETPSRTKTIPKNTTSNHVKTEVQKKNKSPKTSSHIDHLEEKTLFSEEVRIKGQEKLIYVKQCQHKQLSHEEIFANYPFSSFQAFDFNDAALRDEEGNIVAAIVEDEKGIHLVQEYQPSKGGKYSTEDDEGNLFNGISVSIFSNGNIFQGIYHNGKCCGLGYELQANGNTYIGTFKQGLKQGHGTYYWFANNEAYIGQWQGGLPHGAGIYLAKDKYEGSFLNGLKFGFGEENFYNGDRYVGQYVNSVADGYGQYFWKDGSIYKGDFKQGVRHGYGIWQDEHQQYRGYYRLDKKEGFGVYSWKNKQTYKGQFRDDFREGYGQFYSGGNSGKQALKPIFKGCWQKGKKYEEGKVDENIIKQLHLFLQKSQQYDTQIEQNSHRSKKEQKRVGHKNCIPKGSYPFQPKTHHQH